MTTTHEPDRVHELEAKIAELTAIVDRLAPAAVPAVADGAAPESRSSRRGMLKLAGAVAAGAAATVVAKGGQAAAATGDHLVVGNTNIATAGDVTFLTGQMYVIAASLANGTTSTVGTMVGHDTSNDATKVRGGVLGLSGPSLFTPTNQTAHGVVGRMFATAGSGSGVYGLSDATTKGVSAGVRARSAAGPSIVVEPVLTGVPTSGTWGQGSLVPDTTGALWYCTAAGTPGTWINLAAPVPTGATYFAITPTRAYDSRSASPSQGALGSGGNKTLSIKDGRDLATGNVVTADIVPAGAKAITANVTVVNTVSGGFLAINPGGTTTVSAATVNWYTSNQILNNGVNLTINASREVTVICGGDPTAQCDFVIDVTGYFL